MQVLHVFINSWYFPGGMIQSTPDIDYITISTLGNSADFGDLTSARIKMVNLVFLIQFVD